MVRVGVGEVERRVGEVRAGVGAAGAGAVSVSVSVSVRVSVGRRGILVRPVGGGAAAGERIRKGDVGNDWGEDSRPCQGGR